MGVTLRDRYELGAVLGGKGGSTTYLATIVGTGQRCVVKSLSVGAVVRDAGVAQSFDPDDFTKLIELFEREARVLANLGHPGIPRFIDHFTEEVDGDTRLYTVQEHVPGKTLETLVREGRHFTESEARDVCRRIAEILEYLHDRSPPLIHRDIKPANVILDDDGTVHLVDFGSVRDAIGGDLDGKTIVGTYGYMPMEQYEARAVPQSDFYALGMTLVFLLSHREPPQLPRKGVRLDFRPYVNVSEGFAETIERMIEAAPEDRPASAEELLGELGGRRRTAEAATSAPYRISFSLGLVAFVALLGVGGSVFFVGLLDRAPDPFRPPGPSGAVSFQPPEGERPPVRVVDGVASVDIDRDFTYEPTGFPMGRGVGQTDLPPLTSTPIEELRLPAMLTQPDAEVHYGYFPLGNGPDPRIAFALLRRGGSWMLFIDQTNDEDLGNNGPARQNQGSGPIFAAGLFVQVDMVDDRGARFTRPYDLWVWFDEDRGTIRGRFYARNHYAGAIAEGGDVYQATAFEDVRHDGLYRESGLCIDLSRDGECQEETELFRDGDVVPFPGARVRLSLVYP